LGDRLLTEGLDFHLCFFAVDMKRCRGLTSNMQMKVLCVNWKQELEFTRARLRTMHEESEAANEELQSMSVSSGHYTPKHGSWLDLAESELGVLTSQCLDRRIPDKL
jgi:hypothetical protein